MHDDHVVRINTEQGPPLANTESELAGGRCARLLQRPVRETMFPQGRVRDRPGYLCCPLAALMDRRPCDRSYAMILSGGRDS